MKSQKTHIRLRKAKLSDALLISGWNSNPEIFWLTANRKITIGKVRDWLKEILKEKNELCWVIELRQEPIWFITLAVNKDNNFGTLKITLDLIYASRGFGTKALRLALEHAFKKMKLHKVFAEVFSYNTRSIQAFLALGFKYEGIGREEVLINGKYYDEIWLGLLESEFMGRRKEILFKNHRISYNKNKK